MFQYLCAFIVLGAALFTARTLVMHTVLGCRLYNAHFGETLSPVQFFLRQASFEVAMKTLLQSPPGSLSPDEEAWRAAIVASARLNVRIVLGLALTLAAMFVAALLAARF